METWEWDQVYTQFSKIRVQLPWESEAASISGKRGGNEMVKITVGWSSKLKSSETDIIKSFVIDAHNLFGILYKLMH